MAATDPPSRSAADPLDPVILSPVLRGRSILIGVSGGIAAYKVCTLVSRFAQAGATVTVAMTDAAQQFVTPLTFQSLSGRPVYTSRWEGLEPGDPQHIALANSLDLALIAPCTMDTLARLASGHAGDVITLLLSAIDRRKTPILLAPSMNDIMWAQPATQRNIKQLQDDGYQTIGPGTGWMACRSIGPGRMSEPEAITRAVCELVQPSAARMVAR